MSNIYVKLIEVQNELKVSKSQYNSFGKYKYRTQEDILEAVKPLLLSKGLVLFIKDDITLIGERYYVKATATLIDTDTKETLETSALARESMEKKGMDDSQITGTASSYARKYCLNGLFLIDDTKDSDSDEFKKQTTPAPKEEYAKSFPTNPVNAPSMSDGKKSSEAQVKFINSLVSQLAKKDGKEGEEKELFKAGLLSKLGVSGYEQLDSSKAKSFIEFLQKNLKA